MFEHVKRRRVTRPAERTDAQLFSVQVRYLGDILSNHDPPKWLAVGDRDQTQRHAAQSAFYAGGGEVGIVHVSRSQRCQDNIGLSINDLGIKPLLFEKFQVTRRIGHETTEADHARADAYLLQRLSKTKLG